ncbi:MAG: site-specific DNA-methyltransferase [Terrimicrobiaceae bacterium]
MPSLQFKGKALVQNHHLVVPFHELKAVKAKGLSAKPSLHENLVVHGDNLKALKALLPYYHGAVKCIYIDPPYNTGNERWVYNDAVNSPMMKDWIGTVVDREDLTRHDKWCCMMMPRLRLLREFLTDVGVIMMSIDDHEAHHARCLLNEVFGEENFVAQLVWEKGRKNDAKLFSVGHEYILLYARSSSRLRELGTTWREAKPGAAEIQEEYLRLKKQFGTSNSKIETALGEFYKNLPKGHPSKKHARYSHVDDRGVWRDDNMSWPGGDGPTYEVLHDKTGKPCAVPEGGWRYATPEKMQEMIKKGFVEFREDHTKPPIRKTYLVRIGSEGDELEEIDEEEDDVGIQVAGSYFYRSALQASRVLAGIFGKKVFENPKDHEVLARLIRYATGNDKEALVLDAFAGSGSTGHAVLQLNQEDRGSRKFILIEGDDTAWEITSERIRRVIKGVPKSKDAALRKGLGGSFSFFEVGNAMRLETLLKGDKLPRYEDLAGYVFYTATGEEFDRDAIKRKTGFIGESSKYDVYLFYEPDLDYLKKTALTLELAHALPRGSGKPRLVFAPTKYLDSLHLDQLRIEFCQLPFEIYKAIRPKKA